MMRFRILYAFCMLFERDAEGFSEETSQIKKLKNLFSSGLFPFPIDLINISKTQLTFDVYRYDVQPVVLSLSLSPSSVCPSLLFYLPLSLSLPLSFSLSLSLFHSLSLSYILFYIRFPQYLSLYLFDMPAPCLSLPISLSL